MIKFWPAEQQNVDIISPVWSVANAKPSLRTEAGVRWYMNGLGAGRRGRGVQDAGGKGRHWGESRSPGQAAAGRLAGVSAALGTEHGRAGSVTGRCGASLSFALLH